MVEELLHTFFLAVLERSAAELIHEEQDRFVPVPKVLLNQNPDPKLQDSSHTNSTGMRALHNMILKKNKDGCQWFEEYNFKNILIELLIL